MCGGFNCSKNSLIGLNILYIAVACLLISIALYGKSAIIVSNLPIVSGLLGCGFILILISILGFLGALKHHQVMLFFYMVILFLLFLIQFSIAIACLSVNTEQQEELAEEGWLNVNNKTRIQVQETFTCCGLDEKIDVKTPPPVCEDKIKQLCCFDSDIDSNCKCPNCMTKLRSTINYAFKLCGWIGLFFSFTEFFGVLLTVRYRNQKDPFPNPSAFL